MTSIEWLIKELYTEMNMSGDGRVLDEILEQAKEMHKQEMKIQFAKGQEWEHKNMITSADTQVSKTFLESVPKQETLYTEEQMIGFAEWLGLNEYRYSRKYKCYQKILINETVFFTTKELFEKYIQSLKQPK